MSFKPAMLVAVARKGSQGNFFILVCGGGEGGGGILCQKIVKIGVIYPNSRWQSLRESLPEFADHHLVIKPLLI